MQQAKIQTLIKKTAQIVGTVYFMPLGADRILADATPPKGFIILNWIIFN
jgi:hypothetical protein